MADVAYLERLLERVFEQTSARVFRSRIQAVQVERRIERVMEAARSGRGESVVVPWRYRLRLHPADADDLSARTGGGEALGARLATSALAFARAHSYHVARRPVVDLAADPSLARGRIEVDAVADDASPREYPAPAPQPDEPRVHRGPSPTTAVQVTTAPGAAEPAPPASPQPAGPRADPGRVAGLRRATRSATVAVVRVTDRLGRDALVEVGTAPVIIGRATECAILLADAKVSRLHGRLELRRGALWYTDLGSRNGSRVNGTVMDEAMLATGDRLTVGECVLVVESLPA